MARVNGSQIVGIVLAGGKSSRFGRDKALAKLNGTTLLEHSVKLLQDLELDVCVVTSASRDYSFLNCAIQRDLIPEKGPLGGLHTACRLFQDCALLVLTCDMPALTLEALQTLIKFHHKRNSATLLNNPQKAYQPFPGIYETCLVEKILERIDQDHLSMISFLESTNAVRIADPKFDPQIFLNINERVDISLI